jgi:hypothetical protein
MSFTIEDFRDLVGILQQHPEWRAELSRWVLSEELLSLPQAVRELAEAQRRTEERISQLVQTQEGLARQVSDLARQVSDLARQDEVLSQRMTQLDERLSQRISELDERLSQRITQLADQVERLVEVVTRMSTDLERLKGSDLERRYRERAPAYFGRLVRKAHALSHEELAALLEDSVAQGKLSDDQVDEVLEVDLVVRGRQRDTQQELYLVVEVSWGVGIQEVERAVERAAFLARTGAPTVPTVAGSWVTHDAQVAARDKKVWQVTDGRTVPPEAA